MVPCSEGHEHVNFVTPEIVPVGMVSRRGRYDSIHPRVGVFAFIPRNLGGTEHV